MLSVALLVAEIQGTTSNALSYPFLNLDVD